MHFVTLQEVYLASCGRVQPLNVRPIPKKKTASALVGYKHKNGLSAE